MTAKVLWEDRESLYDLMRLRVSIGTAAFASEKQSDPINPDACEWPPDYFDTPGFWFTDWPDSQVKVLALDPSKGKDSRVGDYWAYVDLRLDGRNVWYCDAELRKGPTEELVSTGVEMVKNRRPDGFAVETNQFQELLLDQFHRESSERHIDLPVFQLVNTVNKVVRIRRIGPLLSQRRIRFKKGSPGAELLVEQLKVFPLGDHDDGPDALEMARRLALNLIAGKRISR